MLLNYRSYMLCFVGSPLSNRLLRKITDNSDGFALFVPRLLSCFHGVWIVWFGFLVNW